MGRSAAGKPEVKRKQSSKGSKMEMTSQKVKVNLLLRPQTSCGVGHLQTKNLRPVVPQTIKWVRWTGI